MTTPTSTWEVLILQHGARETVRSDVYMNHAFYGEDDGPFRLGYYLWVLRRGDEVIHVDTGYSAEGAAKRGRTVLVDPIVALRDLGIDPAAGNPLVVTHAHYDHIGNVAAFSASPIHVSGRELDFWTSDLGTRTLFSHFGDQDEVAELVRARDEGRLREVEGTVEIASGVELVELGGHTPGQLVVRVQTATGPVILAADAAHFHEELERDMLFQSMADLPASYRALDWLRSEGEHATIVTGHDASELDRHAPLTGDRSGLVAIARGPHA